MKRGKIKDHKMGCPKLQFWDGGEQVPCWCYTKKKRSSRARGRR
jgi:hypothetical protein